MTAPHRSRQLETHQNLPLTPPLPAPPIPTLIPINTDTSAPIHSAHQAVLNPAGPAVPPEESSVGLAPVTASATHLPSPTSASMNIIELTHEQANVVMKSARLEIIWLMFSCCPIPHHCDCDDMFSHAISTFIQAVLNGAMAKPPDGHQQKLTLAMRDIVTSMILLSQLRSSRTPPYLRTSAPPNSELGKPPLVSSVLSPLVPLHSFL